MVMGIIAGALAGGAKSAASLAEKVQKEAEMAKERAYKEGLLKWQLEEGRKDEADRRDFELGKSVLDNQLRGEQQDKEFAFREKQQKEQIDAQKKIAGMNQGAGRQMSPAQQREFDLMQKRDAAIQAGDTESLKKIDQMLGTKGEKSDFKVLSEDPVTGMKEYGMMTPQGLVRVPLIDPEQPTQPGPATKKPDAAPNWRNYVKPKQPGASGDW